MCCLILPSTVILPCGASSVGKNFLPPGLRSKAAGGVTGCVPAATPSPILTWGPGRLGRAGGGRRAAPRAGWRAGLLLRLSLKNERIESLVEEGVEVDRPVHALVGANGGVHRDVEAVRDRIAIFTGVLLPSSEGSTARKGPSRATRMSSDDASKVLSWLVGTLTWEGARATYAARPPRGAGPGSQKLILGSGPGGIIPPGPGSSSRMRGAARGASSGHTEEPGLGGRCPLQASAAWTARSRRASWMDFLTVMDRFFANLKRGCEHLQFENPST